MGESEINLPFTIERRFGVQWKAIGSFILTLCVVQGGRLAVSPPPDIGAYLHSSDAFISLYFVGFILVVTFLSAKPSKVIVDANGINATSRDGKFFYSWSDIQDYRPLENGLIIEMRGQTKEQNQFNVLPAPKQPQVKQLEILIREGMNRWRGGDGQLHHSFTPSMISRKLYVNKGKTGALFVISMMFSIYASFIISMGLDNLEQIKLSQRGVHAQGQVLRAFVGDCSRTHCDNKIEYRFKTVLNDRDATGYDTVPRGAHPVAPGQAVEVIYDPESPSRSRAVFGGDVHPPSLQAFMMLAGITFAIFVVASLILFAACYGPYRKALAQFPPDIAPRDPERPRARV
jgi:Protein of unknown function (DUF3592)